MRRVIRLGDPTSHGGTVVSAAGNYSIMGKNVARVGDTCTCPKRGHNNCTIAEGDPNWTIDGRAVALEGHKTTCGAVLISTCAEVGRSYAGDGGAANSAIFDAEKINRALSRRAANEINFDEQLQFLSENGKPYSNIDYKLILADGSEASGKTDATGKTERIVTEQATVISRAEFYPAALTCCARHAEESPTNEPAQVVELQGVQTNPQDIGSSVVKVTAEGESRPLTSGEIAMCKLIFKDAIDYSLVKAHNHEYLPLGMQDDNTAMTPDGEIYFNKRLFKEDFSSESNSNKIWFIHEMVHVWQKQLGYWMRLNGALLALSGGYRDGSAYQYSPVKDAGKSLPDFNMEQQGELISHYFAAQYLQDEAHAIKLPFLQKVLAEFFRNPRNASLLPKN